MRAVRLSGGSVPDLEAPSSWKKTAGSTAFMSGDGSVCDPPLAGFDAFTHARELVRLVQCPVCSRPIRTPVTLPCGYSICQTCLPDPHQRQNISYPNTPERQQGIRCPVSQCGGEHALGECSVDVSTSKIVETIYAVVESWQQSIGNAPIQVEEIWDEWTNQSMSEKPAVRTFNGGRLVATFRFAETGELLYHANCSYQPLAGTDDDCRKLDEDFLAKLRESAHKEVDCHVCYNMMYDPVTTPCGHTFCRRCLQRVLDHSMYCPVCRRSLLIPPSLEHQPSNKRLVDLLNGLCQEQVLLRAQAVQDEERGEGEMATAIFVCTLAFPGMPCYLHIFEPRYRLMIRRAMESNRQFGMVLHNPSRSLQGGLGPSHFKQYGTMLSIDSFRMLPDGRSLIVTRGVYRFKVNTFGNLDGYTVGNVERVEDVSLAEEERIEAEEMQAADGTPHSPTQQSPSSVEDNTQPNVNIMSTTMLYETCMDFVRRMQSTSAPWLHHRILEAYGGPPEDPGTFPYWFASVVPIAEEEKYQLLRTTSVRERLKVVVGWIRSIESQSW
jgi:Lon protease-like protein